MNILADPQFTSTPVDITSYNPGVIIPDGNIIAPLFVPFIGTTVKKEIKTPPSLLRPLLLGAAVLAALNILT